MSARPIRVLAIADLHFNRISNENFLTLIENWGISKDIMLIVGDTDLPNRLRKWPFDKTRNVIIPGNTDPNQQDVAFKIYEDKLTVIGCMGANWVDTPWAHHHLHDQPCDPEPVLDWIEHEVNNATTEEIILAIHYPLCYSKDSKDVFYPRFVDLVESDQRIRNVLHGHVHKGAGDLPTLCAQAKIHLVAADNLAYKPKRIMFL